MLSVGNIVSDVSLHYKYPSQNIVDKTWLGGELPRKYDDSNDF